MLKYSRPEMSLDHTHPYIFAMAQYDGGATQEAVLCGETLTDECVAFTQETGVHCNGQNTIDIFYLAPGFGLPGDCEITINSQNINSYCASVIPGNASCQNNSESLVTMECITTDTCTGSEEIVITCNGLDPRTCNANPNVGFGG